MPHKRPVTDNALDATGLDAIKRKKLDESLFSEVLSESGFILNYNNEPYTLETDQALFQRRLLKALRSHRLHCYPASVREFLRGLDAHCTDTGRLKWALLYTQTASGCSAAARAGHQDSLLRLLLNTDELQPAVITLLQERLLEVAYSVSSDDDRSLPRLVLANLQRLDRLTDPAAVSEKMLELLQSAPPEVQKDIITFLPEIVDDSTHPKVAEELCRLYYSSPELSVTILDALPGLRLSAEALLEVKHSVQKTVQAARPEHLPVVVKFLLEDAGKADELIADLRRRIRLPAPSEQAAGAGDGAASQHGGTSHSQHRAASQHSASHEVALLQNIRLAFQLERRQHTAWLKALDGISPPEVHHPLDVLLLLQLHDAAPPRQRLVEAVLKKQVRARLFTRDVLRQTFTAHAQTLKQFVSTLCRLAAFLLRGSEASLVAYGTEMYRLAFVSFSGYQQQEVILGLLSHASDPPAVRQSALRLCQTLADECPDALARYSGFLKGWLDLLEQLTLPEVRQLMEVLSTLAFRAPHEAATVGDELKLLIHKQLASSSGRYKRLGIVSVLMAIKCRQNSGDTSGATATSDDSQSSEIVLTTAGQRETAQLLQLAQGAVSSAAEARGLLLDELASLVWRAGVDPKIESWICDQQMDEFQEAFVVDLPDGEPQCEGLAVSLQHGLEEAAVGEIALNLAPMAMHSPERLVTLCVHFRLLRLCVASLDGGDMEKLDALLGCPVILPAELDPAVVSALPPAAQHATLTALFHCVNFFRELLNAFSTQKDQELKRRCVLRLRAVLQLESQISRLLPLVPGFVPPPAIFDCDAPPPLPAAGAGKKQKPAAKRKGKGGKASGRAAAGADATVNQSTSAVTQPEPTQAPTQGASAPPGSVPGLSGYRAFLRELDMDVYRLLYRRLSLTDHTTEEFCLRPSELRLLLDDLALKLERRLAGGGGGGPFGAGGAARALGFSHLDLLPEASVAKQAATLLKPLSVIADNIVTMFKSQIADNDGVLDGPGMFGEEMGLLSGCLAAVYRIMATLLAWPGLQEPANKPLAQEAVSNLRLTDPAAASGVSQQPSQQLTAARAFALLERHAASVPQLESAVGLARALAALAELAGEPRLHAELADCAESLLKREWFSASGARETGGAHGARVAALLRLLLAPAAGPLLPRLERLAETALSELMEATGREPASETYPTLSKSTFGHYYRALFGALVTAMGGAAAADGARLEQWAAALRVFSQLVGCLRVFSGRGAVGVCLKHSRRLVDLFVRHAIPMLELMLKHQKEEVLTILKNFQLSARYLHHVCNHSKSLKDASLMQHVPYLKKGLEAFVFRVKAMLALNGCSDAFWMGNLKNRDLHGEEILSQRSVADEGGSGSEGEDAEEAEESDVDLDAADERSSPAVGGGSPDRVTDNTGDKPESEVSDAY